MNETSAQGHRETDTPGSGDQPAEDTNIPVVAGAGKEPRSHQEQDEAEQRKGDSR